MVYSKYYLHFSDKQQSKSLKVTQLMKAEQSFDKGNLKHLTFTLWKCFTNFFFHMSNFCNQHSTSFTPITSAVSACCLSYYLLHVSLSVNALMFKMKNLTA